MVSSHIYITFPPALFNIKYFWMYIQLQGMYIIDLNVDSLLVFVFASTKSQKRWGFVASLTWPTESLAVMEVTESISPLATADSLSLTKVLLNW